MIRAVIDSQYVSLKLNAEKGDGITLAKRYGVVRFPTFLYAEADGHELGRVIGTRSNDDYLVAFKCAGRTDPARHQSTKDKAVHVSATTE